MNIEQPWPPPLTSPTANSLPSRLIERQVAALIRSRLVHVFEVGESPQSVFVCEGEGEYGTTESLILAIDRFLPSFALFVGVDGPPDNTALPLSGTAVGRARKNRWEYLESSFLLTTTAAAPAVYA